MYKKVSVWLFVIGITERHLRPNCACPNRAGPADQLQPDVRRLPVPAGQAVRRQVRHGGQGHPGKEHLIDANTFFLDSVILPNCILLGLHMHNTISCFRVWVGPPVCYKNVKDALNLLSPTYTISKSLLFVSSAGATTTSSSSGFSGAPRATLASSGRSSA